MSETAARRLAWSAFVLWALLFLGSAAFSVAVELRPGTGGGSEDVVFALITSAFPIVGILILARQPRNVIGWILMAIGIGWAAGGLQSYGDFALRAGLPGGAASIAIAGPLWAPPIGLMGTFLILRFPDGRLLSPRWRKVEWLSAVAISVTTIAILLSPGDLADSGYPNLSNPIGIQALKPFIDVFLLFLFLIPVTILISAVGLVQRFRRSSGTERLQLKWLAAAAATVAVVYLVAMLVSINTDWGTPATPTWIAVIQNIAVTSFVLIPVAIGFAILKYRLYDIDVVIKKTVVYAVLAAFFTVVYVAVVVGIGTAVGSSSNRLLTVLAAVLMAVAFQPVRERARRFANRLVYGERATPYEVLSKFAERMAATYSTEDVLPQMARILAEGTGASVARVWLRLGDRLRVAASWPDEAPSAGELAVSAEQLPAVPGAGEAVPVVHQGELLGAFSVDMPSNEPIGPNQENLMRDLASHAGLVLRNVRLIEELRASRQRLVAAQDEERRRLERNLHDGAQQQLVALAIKVRLAQATAVRDPVKTEEMLSQVQADAQDALDNLRDLARGIYPPLLADQGLPAALNAQARKSPIAVAVESDGLGRYSQDIEAAVYFCCLEALQNVAKYANASGAVVRLSVDDGRLSFVVTDDGVGFDPRTSSFGTGIQGMKDRVEALGGVLDVHSGPGAGTTVTGHVPAQTATP
jgi:signal transduction histidine kinase